MNAKDTVVGTAKKLVAEIVGDGKLAEEGSRQAGGSPSISAPVADADSSHAALNVWSDLPRYAQERLFTAAADDGIIANALAIFLHDRHPRTAHPPKPMRIA